jgi:flagellar hook-associated protein 2
MATNLISGLSSGIDWKTMVDQLIAVDHQRVDTISAKKKGDETKLAEWQSLNTKLLALKTAAGNLRKAEDFAHYKAAMTTDSPTVKASDLLTVTPSSTSSVGSYLVKVNTLATAEKLSSGSFTSASVALGTSYAGDLLINGTVVSLASTDTLTGAINKINDANSGAAPTGVTAGIVSYGVGDYRMILTSDNTGAAGIGLLNGGASDILNMFGFIETGRTAKNHLAGGDRTDRFSSTTISIQSLLGLTTGQTSDLGEIVINGQAVGAIDLNTDTLSTLQTKFAAAGVTASITTETENNQTYYRLMVSGAANTYTDKNNILETLGFIKGGVTDVAGVAGDVANTAAGAVITAETLIKEIDGYTGYLDTDYIHLEGTDTNGAAVSDDTLVLSDTTTIGDLLAKIKSVFGDVTASVTGDGKLTVMDNTPGVSPLVVTIGVKDLGGAADNTLKFDVDGTLAATNRKRQIMTGADSSVTVDGVTTTRSGNSVNDIIPGVTLDLLKADEATTVSLSIGRDVDAVVAKVNAFVSSYNSISSYIRAQSTYDDTQKKTGGVLFGDGTLASVKSDLTSILTQNVWGVSSNYSTLGLVGVSVDRTGQLAVNSDKLRGYLATNFNDVQKLFAASGTTSVGTLEYISHGINAKQGEYTVHITTAATRSTSVPSDNTSLSGAETLTITEGSSVAVVNLTNAMTMTQIVNAINSELATTYTQVLTGAEPLYADDLQTAKITASTKWNSIYDGGGGSAGLVNGDVISFSGGTRSGASVSGSYTITDIETDSVQGLLSAVETAFGNQVTVAINASGRIVVTDKTQGNSSIALSFDMTRAHDLDFGTVLTTNTGGQKGRYAMEIDASIDSGNHLVLTHYSYGTGKSFTVHQLNNLLWTGGDQTVDNGVDVAGMINGEAATGSGQVLEGNSGEGNVDGLSIKYTGSAGGGIDAGTVKLTFGVAELFDRSLFNITDSLEGYVSYKQQSIQGKISGYQTQIDEMEARLERKREAMTDRFVKMELALQQVQNQSNWLTGQVNAAANGWWKNSAQ